MNANTLDVKHLLMQIYFEQKRWKALERLAAETLRAVPGDSQALRYANAETWFEAETSRPPSQQKLCPLRTNT